MAPVQNELVCPLVVNYGGTDPNSDGLMNADPLGKRLIVQGALTLHASFLLVRGQCGYTFVVAYKTFSKH